MGWLCLAVLVASATICARAALRRWLGERDPLEEIGLAGLVGLGAVGWLTFFVGLVPGGYRFGWVGLAALAVVALALRGKNAERTEPPPRSRGSGGFSLLLGLLLIVPVVDALAPSDPLDWDTIAYHLAVPKLWLDAGRMEHVHFIHQSNFPFAVDNLYVWGLQAAGEFGAKGFTVAFLGFGLLAVAGLARRLLGTGRAAWIAAVGFAGVPVVLWESGTGYVDVAHGLYAGLGLLLLLEALESESSLVFPGLLLGLACASKYTGLLAVATAFVVGLALLVRSGRARQAGRLVACLALAVALAGPWLVRNVANTGNPVFPFFHGVFGGRDWDGWRAEIYREEQDSFGMPGGFSTLAPAVLGLAYVPGRFVNPGQDRGYGVPLGAIGAALPLGAVLLAALGWGRRREKWILLACAAFLVGWFALSQQSRYITAIVPLLALVVAALSARAPALATALVVGQAGYTLWLFGASPIAGPEPIVASKLRFVLGAEGRDEYLWERSSIFRDFKTVDRLVGSGKVALYDVVFGFWLDARYEWANPGHPTRIPYATMRSGEDLVRALTDQGFTHTYVYLGYETPESRLRWFDAMGLGGPGRGFEPGERDRLLSDRRTAWKVLLADAVAADALRPAYGGAAGVLFSIGRP